MRRVPTAVAVLTVAVEEERLGLTVSSFVALSLEPPLVGASISRQAAMHELLGRAEGFALSVLAEGQEAVAAHFARGVPPIAMWHGIETREGSTAPLLAGAIGWLECSLRERIDAGDHTLYVGEVTSVEQGAPGRALVRVDQAYE